MWLSGTWPTATDADELLDVADSLRRFQIEEASTKLMFEFDCLRFIPQENQQ